MWSFSVKDKQSEMLLGNILVPENDNVERLLKTVFSHAVKVLLGFVSGTLLQLRQRDAKHLFVLSVSRSGCVS